MSHVHFTRRGRAAVVALFLLVALVGFGLGRRSSAAAPPPALRPTTVPAGMTMWSLAENVAPDQDPRVTVSQIERLNHLRSPALQAGQLLLLPRG